MRFCLPLPMLPASHLLPLARAAEDAGFHTITVPDSVFFPEEVSADYPYSDDGSRWWPPDTPFVDPFVSIPAMAAVTEHVTFLTNVVKVPLRNPLLLAKQVASIACLSNDRFRLGVGLSWIPEEFEWCGTNMRTRGARLDESIDIVRAVCAGGGAQWVEYHGKHHDFDRLMISPAPAEAVRILVGGHSDHAMKRAARKADGWVSANSTEAEMGDLLARLRSHLDAEGRTLEGFEVNALCVDVFDADGFRRMGDLGVTESQVVPWYYYGGDPNDLQVQLDAVARFGDTTLRSLSG